MSWFVLISVKCIKIHRASLSSCECSERRCQFKLAEVWWVIVITTDDLIHLTSVKSTSLHSDYPAGHVHCCPAVLWRHGGREDKRAPDYRHSAVRPRPKAGVRDRGPSRERVWAPGPPTSVYLYRFFVLKPIRPVKIVGASLYQLRNPYRGRPLVCLIARSSITVIW